jgi:transcriptional regulator with PAS, ATPase and Fis domain
MALRWVSDLTNARASEAAGASTQLHGRLREDLLFRIDTIETHLPPLRERSEVLHCSHRTFLIAIEHDIASR